MVTLTKLGDIINTVKGYAFKSSWFTSHGVPIVKVKDFTEDSISNETLTYIPESIASQYSKYSLQEGDILIQTVGSWEHNPNSVVGKVVRTPKELNGSLLNQNAVKLECNKNIDKRFLYYRLKDNSFKSYIIKTAQGAANQASITLESIRAFQFPLPPYFVQQRIGEILSGYDALITINQRRIKLLQEAAQCQYKLLMEDHDNWDKANLYDFANVQMGFAFDSKFFNEEGIGFPIIRIRDIPEQWTKSYSSQEADPVYKVLQGDILIGMDGEFHMNEWCGQEGYLVQRVCRLRANDPLYHSFLRQALIEPVLFYQNTISGATVAHLGAKHLSEIYVSIPPKHKYTIHLEELNAMLKLRINLHNQNTRLRQARNILLARLMSGEIDVSEFDMSKRANAKSLEAI